MAKPHPALDPAGVPAEIRKHYFLDQYVIIAPGRSKRPLDPVLRGEDHRTEPPGSPAIENDPAIIELMGPDGNWAVKVVENKFPAVSLDWPHAYGKQELVIDTPKHSTEFSQLPLAHIELILEAYRRRLITLSEIKDIKSVTVFKNDGHNAGGTLNHSHTQIMALAIVPPMIALAAQTAEVYREQHGNHCPWCDALQWEIDQKVRIIYEDNYMIAIAPYASAAGYEVVIIPHHHRRRLSDLKAEETHSLAVALKLVTGRLDSVQLSYNFFLSESLPKADDHFYIKVEPHSSIWGGMELATGVIINSVPPEKAAQWYRGRKH